MLRNSQEKHYVLGNDLMSTFAGFVKVSVETARGAAVLWAAKAPRVGGGTGEFASAGVVVVASAAVHRAAF